MRTTGLSTWLWVALLAASLAGITACSTFSKKEKAVVEQPAKLTDIDSPSVTPRKAWHTSAGALPRKDYYSLQLALDDHAVYAADGQGRVSAFDAATGKREWQLDTKSRLVSGPGVSGAALVLGTLDGEVITIDRAKATPLWRAGVSSEVLAVPEGDDDEVIVTRGGDGRLFGLAAQDGQRLWTFDRAVPTLSLRGTSRPLVHDGQIFVGLDSGKVVSLDLATGKLRWETTVSQPGGRSEVERLVDLDADLVLDGDTLYAVSYGGQIAALNATTGETRWKHELSSYSGLAIDSNHLYATDREGRVWAFDRQSGATAWKQEALKYRRLTRPAIQNGYVVVGDFQGYLHWLAPADGKLAGRLRVSSNSLYAPPEVSGGLLYQLDRSGGITAVNIGKSAH